MKFSLSDWSVTLLAGILSSFLLYQFFLDLNAIANYGDEPALGTIVFKKQTATRKAANSQIWERLQNNSPVYQSDTLRTADDSEAVLNFEDGLSLSMLQNTMLKLTMKGQSRTVDFTEGSITLHGSDAAMGSMILGDTGQTLTLSADAQLVVSKTADTMSLELSQGTASVSDESGRQQALSTSAALDLDVKTGAATVRPVDLVPRLPVQAGRLLSLANDPVPVGFGYQVAAGSQVEAGQVEVQVSSQADFSSVAARASGQERRQDATGKYYETNLTLEPGTWFWRVAYGTETYSSPRQFSLDREEPPRPIEPADRTEIYYRKKLPQVRFSWTGREHVVSWTLELSLGSDNFQTPKIRRRTNLNSLSLDGLEPGTWYWRVVPQYEATLMTNPPSPEVRRVSIARRAEMASIQPSLPVEGTVVQIQELTTKGLAFTWDPVPEAKGYELTAWAAKSSSAQTLGRFTSDSPYKVLTPEELGTLAREGSSFWTLRWMDDEGNLSAPGAWRTVVAVDGKLALRPTYPPDGYKIADRFITNTRFSWKSNLTLRTVFQVSRTADFAEILFEGPAQDGTRLGKAWGLGTFYWRLSSHNANGSVFLQTDPRRFDVVEPFPLVRLSEPSPGTAFNLPADEDYTIAWPATKGADYYQVGIYGANTLGTVGAAPRYQTEVNQAPDGAVNKLIIPLSRFPEGAYVARVQAFGRETLLGTSVIGLYGDSAFSFRRLVAVQLTSPADGAEIEGLLARRQGVALEWTTPTPPANPTVELRRVSDGGLVLRSEASGSSWTVSKLPAGEYRWTVKGSLEGFDLSAKTANRLVILEIPKLPAATDLLPADLSIFGPAQLRTLKTLDLSWAPVDGAHEYRLRLFQDLSGRPVFETKGTQPRFSIEKAALQRGTYWWEVEAHTLGPDGEVEREGVSVRAQFTIDLPALSQPKLPEEQKFYGR